MTRKKNKVVHSLEELSDQWSSVICNALLAYLDKNYLWSSSNSVVCFLLTPVVDLVLRVVLLTSHNYNVE